MLGHRRLRLDGRGPVGLPVGSALRGGAHLPGLRGLCGDGLCSGPLGRGTSPSPAWPVTRQKLPVTVPAWQGHWGPRFLGAEGFVSERSFVQPHLKVSTPGSLRLNSTFLGAGEDVSSCSPRENGGLGNRTDAHTPHGWDLRLTAAHLQPDGGWGRGRHRDPVSGGLRAEPALSQEESADRFEQ